MSSPTQDRYADAGVSLDTAEEAKRRIAELVRTTRTPLARGKVGGFGGMVRVPEDFKQPLLVMSTDGVGTKVLVASAANVHDTVGEDLVNHSVNDILVHGARPLAFLDYIATGISVNGHPLQFLRARLRDAGVASSQDMEAYRNGERIVIAGLVVARQHPETAKGTVFLLLEDEFGYMNVIVPRALYARYREVVKFATFMVIEGKFEREDRVMNIIGRRFRELKTEKLAARSHDFH